MSRGTGGICEQADFPVTHYGSRGNAKGGGRVATWGKSTRLGSGGRKRPLGWEKEAGTREAPSCWAIPTAPSELGCDHTTSQPLSLRGRSPSLSPTPTPIMGWVSSSPGGRGLLKQVSVVWTLLTPTCQGDQPGSSPEPGAPITPRPGTCRLWPSAPGVQAGTFDSAPLHPIKPGDRHICTRHEFLQTTESLAEMR